MTTYNTINEAFKNGTGDVFFTRNNQFVCMCRKDDNLDMLNKGFTQLTYAEVTSLSQNQTEAKIEPKQSTIIENMKANLVNSVATCDSYYDEFPDAYGQYL